MTIPDSWVNISQKFQLLLNTKLQIKLSGSESQGVFEMHVVRSHL